MKHRIFQPLSFESQAQAFLDSNIFSDLKGSKYPPTDILAKDDGSVVKIVMAVAGFDPQEISIEEEDTKITISANKATNEDLNGWTINHHEIASRSFSRSWIKKSNYSIKSASFENGVLVIEVLKHQEKSRTIPIRRISQ
jgi:molecular chaperone IbpA